MLRIRVMWEKQSKSSGGKWARRAIDALKSHGAEYDPVTKTWLIDETAEDEISMSAWRELEIIERNATSDRITPAAVVASIPATPARDDDGDAIRNPRTFAGFLDYGD